MIHVNYFGGLSDDSTVDYGLVVWFYRSCMMEDHYLCLKVEYWLRIGVFVYQNHAFAEVSLF